MEMFKKFWSMVGIPRGVRVLTLATSVRWAGWGFAESLIPVMLFSFSTTFAEAGLLRSIFDLGFILALPLAGIAGDRMLATSLIATGLVIYLFVGASYFLAGVTGLALFVVVARFLNGISYAMDVVGRDTYFRRHTPASKVATVFGYFDSVANFWWIVAAIAGIFLIQHFAIHELLFMITPTSLIALVIIMRFRRQGGHREPVSVAAITKGTYGEILREIGQWNWKLRSLAMFSFFTAFCGAVATFFLPIEIYTTGTDLSRTIIVSIMFTVPALFGLPGGKWFDAKGPAVFFYSLAAFAGFLGFLTITSDYGWRLVAAFAIGIIIELLSVSTNELITIYANPEHFGRVGGMVKSIADIGAMMGPLLVGIVIDAAGMRAGFGTVAIIMCILTTIFFALKNFGFLSVADFKHRAPIR